jgi:hypothetical protein
MPKVYEVHVPGSVRKHIVVAESFGGAEKAFKACYSDARIESISLLSERAIIADNVFSCVE